MNLLRIRFHAELIGIRSNESAEPVEIVSNGDIPHDAARQEETPDEHQAGICREHEALENATELLESVVEAIEELEARRSQSLAELQQAAVEIAVIVAANIVRRAISAHDYDVAGVVQEVISRLGAEKPVTVYLHPQDQQLFESLWSQEGTSREVAARIQIEADSKLQQGDCYADAGDFGLLSTVEQQLGDLREMLLEGLEDAEVERRKARSTTEIIRRFPDRRETA